MVPCTTRSILCTVSTLEYIVPGYLVSGTRYCTGYVISIDVLELHCCRHCCDGTWDGVPVPCTRNRVYVHKSTVYLRYDTSYLRCAHRYRYIYIPYYRYRYVYSGVKCEGGAKQHSQPEWLSEFKCLKIFVVHTGSGS